MTLFGLHRSMIFALCLGCPATPGLAQETQGTVVLEQYETGQTCSIPVPYEQQGVNWTYTLRDTLQSPCTFDDLHKVGLVDVPAAVTIRLFKAEFCSRDSIKHLWLELRTTKQPTTTQERFDLTNVFTYPVGSFVRPNVQVAAKGPLPTADNMLDRNVNCVQIENSARQ